MSNHGITPTGRELTDEVLEQLADEAAAGLDTSKAKTIRRGRGRPRIGASPGETFPVRLEPELRQRLDSQALSEGRPAAALVREALAGYLEEKKAARG
ncbi:MAG TPA: CopG family transcriptional regulator [Acidimicrobiales bacterium]|nr:CopG family transcriptional regulator [Acidimicrobiales bacterium]